MRNNIRRKKSEKHKRFFFQVLDTVLSCVVVAPAVIGYWRGTWILPDFYQFPGNFVHHLIVTGVSGLLIQIVFTFAQEYLGENVRPDKHRISFYVISRLYTYVYGLASIIVWRAEWKVLDYYCGTEIVKAVVPTVLGMAVALCLKIFRNVSSSPFIFAVDSSNGYFEVSTMFKLTRSSDLFLYMLDCFFSVFVIESLVIIIWRGTWCLMDIFLFPENEKYSALGSLVIGYSVAILIFGTQIPMEKMSEKLTGIWRLIAADIYVFISFIGTINLWRGVWNLQNIYLLPEFPVLGSWLTHLGCFAFLVLINCSNTVLVRGVWLDGEGGGKCVVFPTFYLSMFFQKHRRKKFGKTEGNCNSCNHPMDDIEKRAPAEPSTDLTLEGSKK